jgi:hypothetical protein
VANVTSSREVPSVVCTGEVGTYAPDLRGRVRCVITELLSGLNGGSAFSGKRDVKKRRACQMFME